MNTCLSLLDAERESAQYGAVVPYRASSGFDTTHWSVVLKAAGEESAAAALALDHLCRTYWYPLYAHVRRRGHGPEDAADLTQEFFATLLRRHSLSSVARDKGRFRTFLLSSLEYFLHDQQARANATKRGGGMAPVALDALDAEQRYALEPRTEETPDKAFDRRWAAALLERAFARLADEQERCGKATLFARLRPFVSRPVEAGEYESLGGELTVPPNTIAKTVQRLRQRARELLLDEAVQTVASEADAARELRELFG